MAPWPQLPSKRSGSRRLNYRLSSKKIRTATFRGSMPARSKWIRRWGGRIVRHRADRPCASDPRRSDDSIVPRNIIKRFRVLFLVLWLLRSDSGKDRFGLQSELFTWRGVALPQSNQRSPHDGYEGAVTAPKASGPDDLQVAAHGRGAVDRPRETVRALPAVVPCPPRLASTAIESARHGQSGAG